MPWKESDTMDQRLQFVHDALSERFTFTELCARYGVSRRIAYKWLARFEEDGTRGLTDRSRRPHACPTQPGPRWRSSCASSDACIPTGVRGNCSRCSRAGTPRSRTGPPRVPLPIFWRGAAWCDGDDGGTLTSIRGLCPS